MPESERPMHSVELVKGFERYIIRWTPGSEAMAIDSLIEWVHNPELKFDWFDSALMAKQVGLHFKKPDEPQP